MHPADWTFSWASQNQEITNKKKHRSIFMFSAQQISYASTCQPQDRLIKRGIRDQRINQYHPQRWSADPQMQLFIAIRQAGIVRIHLGEPFGLFWNQFKFFSQAQHMLQWGLFFWWIRDFHILPTFRQFPFCGETSTRKFVSEMTSGKTRRAVWSHLIVGIWRIHVQSSVINGSFLLQTTMHFSTLRCGSTSATPKVGRTPHILFQSRQSLTLGHNIDKITIKWKELQVSASKCVCAPLSHSTKFSPSSWLFSGNTSFHPLFNPVCQCQPTEHGKGQIFGQITGGSQVTQRSKLTRDNLTWVNPSFVLISWFLAASVFSNNIFCSIKFTRNTITHSATKTKTADNKTLQLKIVLHYEQ